MNDLGIDKRDVYILVGVTGFDTPVRSRHLYVLEREVYGTLSVVNDRVTGQIKLDVLEGQATVIDLEASQGQGQQDAFVSTLDRQRFAVVDILLCILAQHRRALQNNDLGDTVCQCVDNGGVHFIIIIFSTLVDQASNVLGLLDVVALHGGIGCGLAIEVADELGLQRSACCGIRSSNHGQVVGIGHSNDKGVVAVVIVGQQGLTGSSSDHPGCRAAAQRDLARPAGLKRHLVAVGVTGNEVHGDLAVKIQMHGLGVHTGLVSGGIGNDTRALMADLMHVRQRELNGQLLLRGAGHQQVQHSCLVADVHVSNSRGIVCIVCGGGFKLNAVLVVKLIGDALLGKVDHVGELCGSVIEAIAVISAGLHHQILNIAVKDTDKRGLTAADDLDIAVGIGMLQLTFASVVPLARVLYGNAKLRVIHVCVYREHQVAKTRFITGKDVVLQLDLNAVCVVDLEGTEVTVGFHAVRLTLNKVDGEVKLAARSHGLGSHVRVNVFQGNANVSLTALHGANALVIEGMHVVHHDCGGAGVNGLHHNVVGAGLGALEHALLEGHLLAAGVVKTNQAVDAGYRVGYVGFQRYIVIIVVIFGEIVVSHLVDCDLKGKGVALSTANVALALEVGIVHVGNHHVGVTGLLARYAQVVGAVLGGGVNAVRSSANGAIRIVKRVGYDVLGEFDHVGGILHQLQLEEVSRVAFHEDLHVIVAENVDDFAVLAILNLALALVVKHVVVRNEGLQDLLLLRGVAVVCAAYGDAGVTVRAGLQVVIVAQSRIGEGRKGNRIGVGVELTEVTQGGCTAVKRELDVGHCDQGKLRILRSNAVQHQGEGKTVCIQNHVRAAGCIIHKGHANVVGRVKRTAGGKQCFGNRQHHAVGKGVVVRLAVAGICLYTCPGEQRIVVNRIQRRSKHKIHDDVVRIGLCGEVDVEVLLKLGHHKGITEAVRHVVEGATAHNVLVGHALNDGKISNGKRNARALGISHGEEEVLHSGGDHDAAEDLEITVGVGLCQHLTGVGNACIKNGTVVGIDKLAAVDIYVAVSRSGAVGDDSRIVRRRGSTVGLQTQDAAVHLQNGAAVCGCGACHALTGGHQHTAVDHGLAVADKVTHDGVVGVEATVVDLQLARVVERGRAGGLGKGVALNDHLTAGLCHAESGSTRVHSNVGYRDLCGGGSAGAVNCDTGVLRVKGQIVDLNHTGVTANGDTVNGIHREAVTIQRPGDVAGADSRDGYVVKKLQSHTVGKVSKRVVDVCVSRLKRVALPELGNDFYIYIIRAPGNRCRQIAQAHVNRIVRGHGRGLRCRLRLRRDAHLRCGSTGKRLLCCGQGGQRQNCHDH